MTIACPSATDGTPSSNLFAIRSFPVIVDEQPKQHDNRAILRELERERDRLASLTALTGLIGLGGWFAGVSWALNLLFISTGFPLAVLLGKLQTISQQVLLMRRLIEAFEDEGIEIHPRLELPVELKQGDFFLKFPGKKFILVRILTQGESFIVFNEKTERVQIRRRGKGLKNWEPDPLLEIHQQQDWIRRNQPELLGSSSKDRRRPIAKFMVLWGSTKLGEHNERLYSTMANYQALWIKKFGSTCIVQEDQVIEAIKAYLATEK